MGDQHHQQLYGHSATFSSASEGINDSVYQINPNLSINPISEGTSHPINPNHSMAQPTVFYDQAGIYPEMSTGGIITPSNSNTMPQSYNIQPTLSQTMLTNTPQPQSDMVIQTTTNEMYQDNQSGTHVSSPITNMLSFQPLPQQNSNMFQPNSASKSLQNIHPQQNIAAQHTPNLHPNFQAATPPPLSHLQGVTMYQQQQLQTTPHQVPSTTPIDEVTETSKAFKTPSATSKVTKSRSPKKKASNQAPAAANKSTEVPVSPVLVPEPHVTQVAEASPQNSPIISPSTSSGTTSFPKLKDLVARLLVSTLDAYTDKDFGEKTLMNLARKLSAASISTNEDISVLQVWEKAIKQKDFKTGCVCIQRPREGRITVTKSGTGNSGSKKVFPQIVLCQMFRFPNIVFHHDIKSSELCQNPAAVKPNVINPLAGGESGEMGSDLDGIICLNPYHYLVSPEAEARFLKQDKKAARDALKEGGIQQQPTAHQTSLSNQPSFDTNFPIQNQTQNIISKKKSSAKKNIPIYMPKSEEQYPTTPINPRFKPTVPKQPDIVHLSSDDDESDDEIHHFMDDGVDYVKLWEEKAAFPSGSSGGIEELDEKKAFDEIRFLSWSSDDSKFIDTDHTLLEELKVYDEFKSLIISGSYMDVIREIKERRGEVVYDKKKNESSPIKKNIKDIYNKEETYKNSGISILDPNMECESSKGIQEEPDIVLHSITSHDDATLYAKDSSDGMVEHQFITPINITTSASDKTLASVFVDEDENCDETSGSNLSLNLLPSTIPGSSDAVSQNTIVSGRSNPQQTTVVSDEDNVIQDLLKDIRGSFERQFDDEFDFEGSTTKENVEAVPGVIGSSSSHHNVSIRSGGVSPTSFGVNLETDFTINPEEAAEVAAVVADMDIPDSEFLNAGTISQEEFDSFSSFLGNPGRSLHDSTSRIAPPQHSNPLQQEQQNNSNDANQENVFQFQNSTNPQNPQFNLFQHPPTDSSQDFPF